VLPQHGPTPIKTDVLNSLLSDYPNRDSASDLLQGFGAGFRLHYTGPRTLSFCKNLSSCTDHPLIVQNKLLKEVQLGRLAGPFTIPPLPDLRISPIGLVPKREPGEYRLIHHLSYPEGSSVNHFIDDKLASVTYTSFDQAISMVQELGSSSLLAKADIRSAFRLIPISHHDFNLLGIQFDGQYYVDMCLPFGCKLSCAIFEKFAHFLQWAVERNLQGLVLHYLDDFLFGGRATSQHCQSALDRFMDTCKALGIPIAEEKTVLPCTRLTFLGIEIDTEAMLIRIPMDKIERCNLILRNILAKNKTTVKNIQSLIGLLNFLCRAIPMGRPFIRRLIDAISGYKKQHFKLRLTRAIKQDLLTWQTFLSTHNGVSLFQQQFWEDNQQLHLFTDSAGGEGRGFGAYFSGRWAYGTWPTAWAKTDILKDITFLEYFPILVAISIWGEDLVNKKVIFNSDNKAVVSILNNSTSKSKRVMILVRWFTLHCLQLNLSFKGRYIQGSRNVLADALSRLHLQHFKRLAPEAAPHPTTVPESLWTTLHEKLKDS